MVRFASHESINSYEHSWLALFEIVLCLLFLVLVTAFWGGSILFLSVFLSPILLMKTEKSTEYTYLYFSNIKKFLSLRALFKSTAITSTFLGVFSFPIFFYNLMVAMYSPDGFSISSVLSFLFLGFLSIIISTLLSIIVFCLSVFFLSILLVVVQALAIGAIKAFSIVRTLIENPRETLIAIPSNWYRMVFCYDLTIEPELISGIKNIEKFRKFHNIKAFAKNAIRDYEHIKYTELSTIEEKSQLESLLGVDYSETDFSTIAFEIYMLIMLFFQLLTIVVFLFIPSYAYRLSAKMSALVYGAILFFGDFYKKGIRGNNTVVEATRYQTIAIMSATVTILVNFFVPIFVSLMQTYSTIKIESISIIYLLDYFSFLPLLREQKIDLLIVAKIVTVTTVFISLYLSRMAFIKTDEIYKYDTMIRFLLYLRGISVAYCFFILAYVIFKHNGIVSEILIFLYGEMPTMVKSFFTMLENTAFEWKLIPSRYSN